FSAHGEHHFQEFGYTNCSLLGKRCPAQGNMSLGSQRLAPEGKHHRHRCGSSETLKGQKAPWESKTIDPGTGHPLSARRCLKPGGAAQTMAAPPGDFSSCAHRSTVLGADPQSFGGHQPQRLGAFVGTEVVGKVCLFCPWGAPLPRVRVYEL